MPYAVARDKNGHTAEQALALSDPEHGEERGLFDPVFINYSAGLKRAIMELTALFDFNSGEWEKAAFSLVAEEYDARSINAATPRAIGLWLWDFVDKERTVISREKITRGPLRGETIETATRQGQIPRGVIARAVRQFESQFDLIALCVEKVEYSDFRFFYDMSNKCIADCRVYPFSKRGTKKKKMVPGT